MVKARVFMQRIVGRLSRIAFRLVLRLPEKMLLRICNQEPHVRQGRTLDPRIQFHAWFVRRFRVPRVLTPTEFRKPTVLGLGLLEGTPLAMAELVDRDIPGPGGPLPVRLYRPVGVSPRAPILIYFHFGGWVIGDIETCHTACSVIAHHAKCLVLSVAYRLAPEHKFPAAVDDAVTAFQWARETADELGGDPDAIGVGGDSAGATLAAAVSLVLRDSMRPIPRIQLLICPVVDMDRHSMPATVFDGDFPLSRDEMIWFADLYTANRDDLADPRCSIGRATTLRGLPKTILILAGHDLLHDEGLSFSHRLKADGVDCVVRSYNELSHAFTVMSGGVPAARTALVEIGRLVSTAMTEECLRQNLSEKRMDNERYRKTKGQLGMPDAFPF